MAGPNQRPARSKPKLIKRAACMHAWMDEHEHDPTQPNPTKSKPHKATTERTGSKVQV